MIFFPQKKVVLTSNLSLKDFNSRLKEIINKDSYSIKLIGQYDESKFHITHHVFNTLFNLWYNGKWTKKNDNLIEFEIDIKYEVGERFVYFFITFIILIIIYFIGFWVLSVFLLLPYAYIASFISEDSNIVLKCLTKDLNAKIEKIESKHLFTSLFNRIHYFIHESLGFSKKEE